MSDRIAYHGITFDDVLLEPAFSDVVPRDADVRTSLTRTITLTVRGGLDTDSNGATAGSVAGVLTGADAIPDQWKEPLEDRVRSAVFGFDGVHISELAERTVRLARTET